MANRDEEEFYNEELEEERQAQKATKKKRFRFFNSQREGKGVSKEDADIPTNFVGFFKRYGRDFSRLLSVNLFYILGCFPLIFCLIAMGGAFQIPYTGVAENTFFPIVDAMGTLGGSNAVANGLWGAFLENNAWTVGTYILMGLGGLAIFTFGAVNAGTTFLIRNMLKGEPVFMWADFWRTVKRNWKQALPFGIFDLFFLFLIPFNLVTISMQGNMGGTGFLTGVFFWFNLLLGIIYLFMRFYIYLQMISFDLKITKILKNSLIFAFIGFKRNILAFLGAAILILLTCLLVLGGGFFLPLGLAMPLVLLFSNCAYMCAYAAYFKIKEVMIDPYYAEHPEEAPEEDPEEAPEEEPETDGGIE